MVTEALVCWCDCPAHVGYRSAHVRAIDQDIVRTWFYVWCLVGCPLIGWSAAVFGTHGEGGVAKFVFLFVGIPALLALGLEGFYTRGKRPVSGRRRLLPRRERAG